MVNDELAATSLSEYSDPRVKLELLTKEEIQFLANDYEGLWANVLAEYSNFDYAAFNLDSDHTFMGIIMDIDSFTYYGLLSYLYDCGILYLFCISED